MPDWDRLITAAANDEREGDGPNARRYDQILSTEVSRIDGPEAVDALIACCEVALRRAMLEGRDKEPDPQTYRTLADVVVQLSRAHSTSCHRSSASRRLQETAWAFLSIPAGESDQGVPPHPFSAVGRSRVYTRVIARELGSILKFTESETDLHLLSGDPSILLDCAEFDGDFDLFESLLMFYCYQAWIHPSDVVLRFERWLKFIERAGRPDLSWRRPMTLVDSAPAAELANRRAAASTFKALALLAESGSAATHPRPYVYDGRELGETIRALSSEWLGELRAANPYLTDSLSSAHEIESSRLQVEHAKNADRFFRSYYGAQHAASDIVRFVSGTVQGRQSSPAVRLEGPTSAQIITLMRGTG